MCNMTHSYSTWQPEFHKFSRESPKFPQVFMGIPKISNKFSRESPKLQWVTWLIDYRVATVSRLLKIIGLFCRILSLLLGSFAKETCNVKEPTNRSHPISHVTYWLSHVHLNHTTDGGDLTENNYGCQHLEQIFTGVSVHFKQVFTGIPKFPIKCSHIKRESPSLPWTNRNPVRSGDASISSQISSVEESWIQGHISNANATWQPECTCEWVTCEWFMDSGSYVKCECDVAAWMHMWMSHVVAPTHMWMIHGFGVISQMWVRRGSLNLHVNESWLIHVWGMTYAHVRHDSFMCQTTTHSYVWHDSFTRETWLIHACDVAALTRRTPLCCVTQTKWWWIWDMTHSYMWRGSLNSSDAFVLCDITDLCVWHASFICVTWLIHMWDMTHSYMRRGSLNSYVWRDSFICVTWLIHMCDMTHSYVRHASFICETRLIHMCDMTRLHVRHDSFICVTWQPQLFGRLRAVWHEAFIRETWFIHMCDVAASIRMCNVTHSRVRLDLFIWDGYDLEAP